MSTCFPDPSGFAARPKRWPPALKGARQHAAGARLTLGPKRSGVKLNQVFSFQSTHKKMGSRPPYVWVAITFFVGYPEGPAHAFSFSVLTCNLVAFWVFLGFFASQTHMPAPGSKSGPEMAKWVFGKKGVLLDK